MDFSNIEVAFELLNKQFNAYERPKYLKLIRESAEFSEDQIKQSNDRELFDDAYYRRSNDMQANDQLNSYVLKFLQKKEDKEAYKCTVKQCKQLVKNFHTESCVGDSLEPLLKAHKKIKKHNV